MKTSLPRMARIVELIDEGPKVRVGELVFEGNPKLPQAALESAFKENKEHGIIAWLTGKDSFKESAVPTDLANLKTKLQESGYMEATIGEPRFEDMRKTSIFLKKQPMKRIIVPVDAGYRYASDQQTHGRKPCPQRERRWIRGGRLL